MCTENMLAGTAEITLGRLEFDTPGGVRVAFDLQRPLTLPEGRYSAYAVCRMCVARLPIRTLERLLLSLFLDEMECGVARPHSYGELGLTLCKCAHSVKGAMAALRAAGLVTTSRVGFGDGALAVSCESLLRWAERAVSAVSKNEARVSETAESVSETGECVSKNDECVSKRAPRRTHPRRGRRPVPPAAKKEDAPAPSGDAPVAAMREAEGPGVSRPVEEDFDPPVDGSEEVRGTLAAAGRAAGAQDDEDDFSFGSETAETDIGHGVRMNPDL